MTCNCLMSYLGFQCISFSTIRINYLKHYIDVEAIEIYSSTLKCFHYTSMPYVKCITKEAERYYAPHVDSRGDSALERRSFTDQGLITNGDSCCIAQLLVISLVFPFNYITMSGAVKSFVSSMKKTVTKAGGSMSGDTLRYDSAYYTMIVYREQMEAFRRCFRLPVGERVLAIGKCEIAFPHGSFWGYLYIMPNCLAYLSSDEALKVM